MREVLIDGIRYVPEPQRVTSAQTIGAFLCQHRKRLRMSLKVAAGKLGMSVSSLHGLENGTTPGLDTSVRLADFYGFKLEELAERVRSKQPTTARPARAKEPT